MPKDVRDMQVQDYAILDKLEPEERAEKYKQIVVLYSNYNEQCNEVKDQLASGIAEVIGINK